MEQNIWEKLDSLLPKASASVVPAIGTRVKITTPLQYADCSGDVVDYDPIGGGLYEVLLFDERRIWFRREEFEVPHFGGLSADCRVKIRKPHPHAGSICKIIAYIMNDDMIGWYQLMSVGYEAPLLAWFRDTEFEVLQDLPLYGEP